MKKFFVLTISMLTLLCCVPLFACAGGATGDNGGLFGEGVEEKFVDTQYGITYTLQEDDTYAVTNYAQELELSEIVIKDVIEDKPVTSIAPQVFKNKGYNATSKKGIKTVVLPESLVSIGEQAFYECRVLSAINLENVQYIGARAFYNCGNIGCEQPNTIILTNVKEIGEGAFACGNASNVKSVVIGENCQIFYENMLSNASSLQTVTITNVDCQKWSHLGFLDYGSADKFPSLNEFLGQLSPLTRPINEKNPVNALYKYNGCIMIETPEALAIYLSNFSIITAHNVCVKDSYAKTTLNQSSYNPRNYDASGFFLTDIPSPKYQSYYYLQLNKQNNN